MVMRLEQGEDEPEEREERSRKEQATGELVDDERRRMCIEMLGRPDVTRGEICRTLHMDSRTVNAICAEYLPEVADAKVRIARMAFESTIYNLASATERAKEGKGTALDAKMSFEVYMGAMGEASQVLQVNHEFPALTEFGCGGIIDV